MMSADIFLFCFDLFYEWVGNGKYLAGIEILISKGKYLWIAALITFADTTDWFYFQKPESFNKICQHFWFN